MKINKVITGAVLSALALTANAAPTNQEIFDMMQEMKAEIKSLKTENSKLKGTVEEVAVATDEAIKAQVSLFNKTTIGGYGELHYNALNDQKGTSDTEANFKNSPSKPSPIAVLVFLKMDFTTPNLFLIRE